jgi:predicted nuclease of predicted toxin-antitoxin system
VKLLLDEMLPDAVAEQLRARGYDVIAVTERTDLRGRSDSTLLNTAQLESRAVVTENIDDFRTLAGAMITSGAHHTGLVLTSSRAFPRGNPRTIGRLVTALERLLETPPEGDSWERWLG